MRRRSASWREGPNGWSGARSGRSTFSHDARGARSAHLVSVFAGEVGEFRQIVVVVQAHDADRAVALLADDHLGEVARLVHLLLPVEVLVGPDVRLAAA